MTKKLVIIDDSSTQLNILKALFANNGWEVCGVQSAKIGYEIIFDFAPDLIITDAIMPLMGGFQLIKMIRENGIISKIPVIVYSILNESNAKFYIKEELSEYFLRKENNQDELLHLAQSIVEKYPLSREYKDEILRTGLKDIIVAPSEAPKEEPSEEPSEIQKEETIEEIKFDFEAFREKIKTLSNFSFGDEKIFSNIFSVLYNELGYNLAVFNVYSFENEETKAFFDIRNIILSPILRNSILTKFQTQNNIMYKKYSPNLNTIVNESEFLSKVEFSFNYKEENIGNVIFYSNEKSKWEDEEKIAQIQEVLYGFFKTRFIQRNSQKHSKEDKISNYAKPLNKFDDIKNTQNTHFGIIQIANYSDLKTTLTQEELDTINSKISEKIIECLEKNEQVYRNDEDEYDIVIFTKDNKHAKYRFEYILRELEEINYNTYKLEIFIAGASCIIDGNFNIIDARKFAREILEQTHQDKVVIHNAG